MAFGNPAAERAALEALYEDTARVQRPVPQASPGGAAFSYETVYEKILCALSNMDTGGSGQTRAENRLETGAVLFTGPEHDIQPGDSVQVERFGRDRPGGPVLYFEVQGPPVFYATHQEVRLAERGMA